MHKKAVPVKKSSFEECLSPKVPETKISLPLVKNTFLNRMILFSTDASDKRAALAARTKASSQRLVRIESRHFVPHQNTTAQKIGTESSPPPLTTSDCRGLRRPTSIEPTRLEFTPAAETPPHKPQCGYNNFDIGPSERPEEGSKVRGAAQGQSGREKSTPRFS